MKKKVILSGLTCAALLSLTGCQAVDGLFGGSPTYSTNEPYGHMGPGVHHRAHGAPSNQGYSSTAGSSASGAANTKGHRAKSTAVPVERPSVKTMSITPRNVPSVNPSVSSGSATSANTSSSGTMPTPSVQTIPAAAPNMTSPTVGQ